MAAFSHWSTHWRPERARGPGRGLGDCGAGADEAVHGGYSPLSCEVVLSRKGVSVGKSGGRSSSCSKTDRTVWLLATQRGTRRRRTHNPQKIRLRSALICG